MTEQENELLEMYIKYIRKRNLIIFIIAFIVVISVIYGVYKFKNLNNYVEDSNLIEENNINEEIKVENNTEIIEEKVEETTISNEKIKIEKKEEDKKPISITNTKQNTKENTTNNTNTTNKPSNKEFLFTEGYTMENVTQAAQEYLKSSGHAGKCVPIQDKDGIYLGMKVIFD